MQLVDKRHRLRLVYFRSVVNVFDPVLLTILH